MSRHSFDKSTRSVWIRNKQHLEFERLHLYVYARARNLVMGETKDITFRMFKIEPRRNLHNGSGDDSRGGRISLRLSSNWPNDTALYGQIEDLLVEPHM